MHYANGLHYATGVPETPNTTNIFARDLKPGHLVDDEDELFTVRTATDIDGQWVVRFHETSTTWYCDPDESVTIRSDTALDHEFEV